MAQSDQAQDRHPWGRVDDDGTVYVREADGERAVGQYPDATPEEALAYFERKYVELAGQVSLLEQRVTRRRARARCREGRSPRSARPSPTANAVGDLPSLDARLEKLSGQPSANSPRSSPPRRRRRPRPPSSSVRHSSPRSRRLAAQDPAKAQWKQVTAKLDELFARWQAQQQDGPRLPKNESERALEAIPRGPHDDRDAPQGVLRRTRHHPPRRAHPQAGPGRAGRGARAEGHRRRSPTTDASSTSGSSPVAQARRSTTRCGRSSRPPATCCYAAKAEADAVENAEFAGNLELKLAVLDDAEKLLTETDRVSRQRQACRRSSVAGTRSARFPRDNVKVGRGPPAQGRDPCSQARRGPLEQDRPREAGPIRRVWPRSSQARSRSSRRELADAKAAGDKKRIAEAEEALQARKVWLDALGSYSFA